MLRLCIPVQARCAHAPCDSGAGFAVSRFWHKQSQASLLASTHTALVGRGHLAEHMLMVDFLVCSCSGSDGGISRARQDAPCLPPVPANWQAGTFAVRGGRPTGRRAVGATLCTSTCSKQNVFGCLAWLMVIKARAKFSLCCTSFHTHIAQAAAAAGFDLRQKPSVHMVRTHGPISSLDATINLSSAMMTSS